MSNPIQDWLNKFKTPAQTASGQASAGTTGKATATGQAGYGTGTSSVLQTDLQKQKDAMALKTNQQVINAAYKVAEELKLKGGPWPLLRAAGWGHLTDKRGDHYQGKAIDEIEKLTPEQKSALKRILGL